MIWITQFILSVDAQDIEGKCFVSGLCLVQQTILNIRKRINHAK